jgi:phosphate-selective porin OprO/OprP
VLLRSLSLAVAIAATAAPPAHGDVEPATPGRQDTQEVSPNVGLFRLPAGRGQGDALAGPEGFGFLSKNDNFGLMIHWILQADVQSQLGYAMSDAERLRFLVRYAGLALTTRLYKRVRSELLVSFSQSQLNLSEAYLDAEATSWLHFKAGKFHYPISLERITTAIFFPLADASLTSTLLPSADVGAQLWGRLGAGVLEYNLAVVNGATAGAPVEIDVDVLKDFVGRVLVKPFRWSRRVLVQDFAVGFGASAGKHKGAPSTPQLPRLQSWGGRTWLAFKSDGTALGTVVADGLAYKLVPQLSWNARMVSAYAEYARTVDTAAGQSVTMQAWSVVLTVVATGEDALPLHYVVPRHNLDLRQHCFGALELTASTGGLYIDAPAALLAPVAAARSVNSFGGGVNWYPAMAVRVMLDLEYTRLAALSPLATARDELLLVGRLQLVL